MGKKKKTGDDNFSPDGFKSKKLDEIFSKDPATLTSDEKVILFGVTILTKQGITPSEYGEMYEILKDSPLLNLLPIEQLFSCFEEPDDSEDMDDIPSFGSRRSSLSLLPMPGADKKSLVLKIQLRGVSKPPLWREVEIPADMTFYDLHRVIQILFDWDGGHLWQFEEKPYGDSYIIGMPHPSDIDFGGGPTDDAHDTLVSTVLKKPKDKMIYIYDFGDDWIHDISVKEVKDTVCKHPVCLKWKSDNPIEDMGAIWGFENCRDMYENSAKHTKAEREEFIDNYGFESIKVFKEFMDTKKFNLDEVNSRLSDIR